jgi:uncharacterized membrane protein
MTLRQYLDQGQFQDWVWLTYPIGLVICALVFTPLLPWIGPTGVLVGVALSSPVAYTYAPRLLRLRRCPRCLQRLGELADMAVFARGNLRWGPRADVARRRLERLGKCPHCRLRLDDEIDTQKTA